MGTWLAGLANAGSSIAQGLLAARAQKAAQAQQDIENKRQAAQLALQQRQQAFSEQQYGGSLSPEIQAYQGLLAKGVSPIDALHQVYAASHPEPKLQKGLFVGPDGKTPVEGFTDLTTGQTYTSNGDVFPNAVPWVNSLHPTQRLMSKTLVGPDGKPMAALQDSLSGAYYDTKGNPIVNPVPWVNAAQPQTTDVTRSVTDPTTGLTTTTEQVTRRGSGGNVSRETHVPPAVPAGNATVIAALARDVANGNRQLGTVNTKIRGDVEQQAIKLVGDQLKSTTLAMGMQPSNYLNPQALGRIVALVTRLGVMRGLSQAEIKALTTAITQVGGRFTTSRSLAATRQQAIQSALGTLGVQPGTSSSPGSPNSASPTAPGFLGGTG